MIFADIISVGGSRVARTEMLMGNEREKGEKEKRTVADSAPISSRSAMPVTQRKHPRHFRRGHACLSNSRSRVRALRDRKYLARLNNGIRRSVTSDWYFAGVPMPMILCCTRARASRLAFRRIFKHWSAAVASIFVRARERGTDSSETVREERLIFAHE